MYPNVEHGCFVQHWVPDQVLSQKRSKKIRTRLDCDIVSLGKDGKFVAELKEAADVLLARFATQEVLVTSGYCKAKRVVRIPVVPL